MSDYAVVNPATGEVVKEYPTISDLDLDDAITRADKCHSEWDSSTTVEERAEHFAAAVRIVVLFISRSLGRWVRCARPT